MAKYLDSNNNNTQTKTTIITLILWKDSKDQIVKTKKNLTEIFTKFKNSNSNSDQSEKWNSDKNQFPKQTKSGTCWHLDKWWDVLKAAVCNCTFFSS